jgi:hypothetical protein
MMSWDDFKSAIVPAAITVVVIWATLVLLFTAGAGMVAR